MVTNGALMKLDMNGVMRILLVLLSLLMRVSQSNASMKQVHSFGSEAKLFYLFVACNAVLLHANPANWWWQCFASCNEVDHVHVLHKCTTLKLIHLPLESNKVHAYVGHA